MTANGHSNGKTAQQFDFDEVRRAAKHFIDGHVIELRALDATMNGDRRPAVVSGYFDNIDALVTELGRVNSAKGVYLTINPVAQALLARAQNRLKIAGRGEITSDNDVAARRFLLIDADAKRPAGISASDDEHQAAIALVHAIVDDLKFNYGWPEPLIADSGNGAHALYRIRLNPIDGGLVEKVLKVLDQKYSTEGVKIDTSVFNPSRIGKLYGSLACKGDSTVDRPHRMSRIISEPNSLSVVSRELLDTFVAELAHEPKQTSPPAMSSGFDIDAFIARNNLDVGESLPYQGGRKWILPVSPMCEHHGDGPYLIQFPNGALAAGCHHDSCNWDWKALRARFEPKGAGMPDLRPAEYREEPAPEPIVVELGQPFPIDALPNAVADYVGGTASAIGCDPSYVALPLLSSLARAIGNKRVIRLKLTWTEPAVIWAAIIGKSGTHKTPALMASMRFLERKQGESIAAHVEALANFEQVKAVFDRDYAAWKRLKNTTEPPPWAPVEPVCERYVTTDTTIEALTAMLAGQFDGLLVSRDELAGWLGGMGEYKGGQGSDLGHWLTCWSGTPLTVDRKTGAVKMLHIPRAAVSLIGGIQPGVLRTAIGREHMQDGLCARLLMAMPEPRQVKWTEAIVEPAVELAMQNVFDRLLSLDPAADSDGRLIPFPLSLSPAAKSVWIEYFNRHRAELKLLDDDLAAAWSKLEAYTARFALIFQLCQWAAGAGDGDVVDERNMETAIQLSDWFGGEAKRVYGLFGESNKEQEQRELVELIQRMGDSTTIRELTHAGRRYRGTGQAEAALWSLVKAGWGTWQVESTPGRPRTTFKLHPGSSGNGNTSQ